MSTDYDKTRALYLTTETRADVRRWMKRLEIALECFMPAERFIRMLLDNEEKITYYLLEHEQEKTQ